MFAKHLQVLDLLIRDADGPPKQTGATHLCSIATECSMTGFNGLSAKDSFGIRGRLGIHILSCLVT